MKKKWESQNWYDKKLSPGHNAIMACDHFCLPAPLHEFSINWDAVPFCEMVSAANALAGNFDDFQVLLECRFTKGHLVWLMVDTITKHRELERTGTKHPQYSLIRRNLVMPLYKLAAKYPSPQIGDTEYVEKMRLLGLERKQRRLEKKQRQEEEKHQKFENFLEKLDE